MSNLQTLPEPAPAEKIWEVIRSHSRIAILGHLRPDADAIGSQLALGHALTAAGKEILVLNEDGVPPSLAFLPGTDSIVSAASVVDTDLGVIDLVIALDTSNHERLGQTILSHLPSVDGETPWINIDHHISNELYGDVIHVDATAAATGEILFGLINAWGIKVGDDVRDCLFAAISTDTGSFRYPNTTARTFSVGSELVKLGVDVGRISQELYESFPLRRLEMTRELFKTLQLDLDGRVATWVLSREVIDRLGLLPSDAEGLIDTLRSIDQVELAIFFEAMPEGKVRMSARSKEGGPNVCDLCGQFGGGGHRLAAGARLLGPVDEARERVIKHVTEITYGSKS